MSIRPRLSEAFSPDRRLGVRMVQGLANHLSLDVPSSIGSMISNNNPAFFLATCFVTEEEQFNEPY